ncbi:hypothetical protein G7Z17_g6372 [Cylindrodendrum hubeiense]|uniref:Uncharacterized protein n=1 Tax=Cylindrodendrum hubeiense TaxID=595255 RepID=A0A9P5HDB1_9HYPO|nr:hypothetical protein G7Z17_g6372 [Cylindrodendrum hubeiense]
MAASLRSDSESGSSPSHGLKSSSSSRRMPPFKAHWATPSLMIGSVFLGLLLAVGHHLFYSSKNGQIVTSSDQQVWNLRVGTGLAFLVKASLTAAASMAYTQLLWHTLRSQEISLNGIDAVFSVVNNLYAFTTVEIWLRSPALVCIAFMIWLLPFVAIVTPSALTVQSSQQLNESTVRMPLPVIAYASPKTFAQYANSGGSGYQAPSNAISRLIAGVTSQGSISQITAPFSNCSYTVEFYGPSFSCGDVSKDSLISAQLSTNLVTAADPLTYAGFVPRTTYDNPDGQGKEADAVFGLNVTLNASASNANFLPNYDKSDSSKDHARIYVIVPALDPTVTSKVVECGLFNTSYVVDFTFQNGLQDITVRKKTRLNGVVYNTKEMNTLLDFTRSMFGDKPENLSIGNMTMIEALEQTVTNITISLFSNSYFL